MKNQINLILLLIITSFSRAGLYNPEALGGWAISKELFMYIYNHVEHGKNILELGSGSATQELSKYFNMFSIEHNKKWLNKYNTTYVYAPIKNYGSYKWYDVDLLVNLVPEYELILIDGPPGPIGRYGFYHQLHLFNTDGYLIFDDVQRKEELRLLKDVSSKLERPYEIHECRDGKKFGVIKKIVTKNKRVAGTFLCSMDK